MSSSLLGRTGCCPLAIPRRNNLIDQTIGFRLLRGHKAVALSIFGNFRFGLAGMAHQDIIERIAHTQNLTGVNFNLSCLPLHAPERLMDQNGRIRQRKIKKF